MPSRVRHRSAPAAGRAPSFVSELNVLSRAIDQALIKRAGGVVLVSAAGIGMTLASFPASAATFTVDSLADASDSAIDGTCATAAGACTLRAAIEEANSAPGADQVEFETGVSGTIALTNGPLSIYEPLDINGPGSDAVTVDANESSRIFYLGLGAVYSAISGLTLTDGDASGSGGAIYSRYSLTLNDVTISSSYAGSDGGGVYISGGELTLVNSIVTGNEAGGDGGGIALYTEDSDGEVTLINSTVSYNTAGYDGGGIYLYSFYGYDYLTLTNSAVSNNTAGSDGGGIAVSTYYGDGNIEVNDSTVSGNTAESRGGGIFVRPRYAYSPYDSSVSLNRSTVNGNTAENGRGGGLYVAGNDGYKYGGDAAVTLLASTVTDNSSNPHGGGIFVSGGDSFYAAEGGGGGDAVLDLTDSIVSDNAASAHGGGIFVSGGDGGYSVFYGNGGYGGDAALAVTHSTLSDNTAGASGGGIFLSGGRGGDCEYGYCGDGGDAVLSMTATTVSGNVANVDGGGVFAAGGDGGYGQSGGDGGDGALRFTQTTLSGNRAGNAGGAVFLAGGHGSDGYAVENGAGGSGGSGVLNLANSTVSGNSATAADGGAIFIVGGNGGYGALGGDGDAGDGILDLTYSTVSGNTAANGDGGAFFVAGGAAPGGPGFGAIMLANGIVANNAAAPASANPAIYASSNVSGDHTLVEDATGTTLTDGTSGNIVGQDPGLGPLQNNGGPTLTHAITSASPAYDAGYAACPPAYDQRGAPFIRVAAAQLDMGAYEYIAGVQITPTLVVNDLGDPGTDGLCTTDECTLREAVSTANGLAGANTVTFEAGLSGTIYMVAAFGNMDITDEITITGPGAAVITVDAQGVLGDFSGGVFNVAASAFSATLSGLTLTGGNVVEYGGAIHSEARYLTLTNMVIDGNQAQQEGGGVNVFYSGGAVSGLVVVDNSTLSGNTSVTDSGGGINVRGAGLSIVNGSRIITNTAAYLGGGVRNFAGSGVEDVALTITNSTISGNTTTSGNGGGISALVGGSNGYQGLVHIAGSVVSNNSAQGATSDGGGLHSDADVLEIINSDFEANTAGNNGGAVAVGASSTQSLLVQDSDFRFNVAGRDLAQNGNASYTGGSGGALEVNRAGFDVTITGSDFVENTAYGAYLPPAKAVAASGKGGGVHCGYSAAGGGVHLCLAYGAELSITGSTFEGNAAVPKPPLDIAPGGGAFIDLFRNTTAEIAGTVFRGNNAQQGGGLHLRTNEFTETTTATISGSLIAGNSADARAGGLNLLAYGSSNIALANSTVSGNTGGSVGGIFAFNGSAGTDIRHATITGNTGSVTGGIYSVNSDMTLANAIVAGNRVAGSPDDTEGAIVADYSLIQAPGSGLVNNAGNLIGASYDPRLGPLQSNGGPTFTHAIDAASAAFNAGSNAYATALNYDQRGAPYAREIFGTVDMGAFEFQGPIPVTLSIDKTGLNEDGSDNPATISACLPPGVTAFENVVVSLDVAGAATPGADHDLADGATVTISNGSQCGTVPLNALDDPTDELNESVVVGIATLPADYTAGAPNQVSATLLDNDGAATVSLSLAGSPFNEAGGAATVTATLNPVSGQEVTVDLGFAGLAVNGTDFTASGNQIVIPAGTASSAITLTGVDDADVEGIETAEVSIINAVNAQVGSVDSVTAQILDDDQVPTAAVTSLGLSVNNIQEGSPFAVAAAKSAHTSLITVTLDAPSPGDVTVTLGFTGEAVRGTDFTVTGNPVIIPANATSGSATVTALPDNLVEGDEPFTVTVLEATCTPDCAVTIPEPPPGAQGLIVDDDQALEDPAAPIPALGPLGLLLLPLLIPIAGWRYWRKRV